MDIFVLWYLPSDANHLDSLRLYPRYFQSHADAAIFASVQEFRYWHAQRLTANV
jgi:hypothetical protein